LAIKNLAAPNFAERAKARIVTAEFSAHRRHIADHRDAAAAAAHVFVSAAPLGGPWPRRRTFRILISMAGE
jgi:hypothetical protein